MCIYIYIYYSGGLPGLPGDHRQPREGARPQEFGEVAQGLVYVCVQRMTYIYIYIERERDTSLYIHMYIYIYIHHYIYIYTHPGDVAQGADGCQRPRRKTLLRHISSHYSTTSGNRHVV